MGATSKQYAQVGNAVPPLLAQAIGNALFQALYGFVESPQEITQASMLDLLAS